MTHELVWGTNSQEEAPETASLCTDIEGQLLQGKRMIAALQTELEQLQHEDMERMLDDDNLSDLSKE